MALHFYMNGTTGARDGVEISNGDLSNPLVFDGFYIASGVTLSKTKTIHIRADAGEVWKMVVISCTSSSVDKRGYFSMGTGAVIYWVKENYFSRSLLDFFPEVTDINKAITITAQVKGNDTDTPDTISKITVIQGVKI